LINGVQPVVSAGYPSASPTYQETAFGWVTYPGVSGYMDGDGGTKLVSNFRPVRQGLDGRFYSTVPFGSSGNFESTTLENGVWLSTGVSVPNFWNNAIGISTADAMGRIYVAEGPYLGTSGGGLTTLSIYATDLAVSRYGDIAVSGYSWDTDSLAVTWYDYGVGAWRNRSLAVGPDQFRRVGIEFDQKGNLGVAYVDTSFALHFAYLDMAQDFWTDEIVTGSVGSSPFIGTALDFNSQDLPVIAAGNVLAYDPIEVPEPAGLLIFSAVSWIFVNRRTA